jgi:hypothetical protein
VEPEPAESSPLATLPEPPPPPAAPAGPQYPVPTAESAPAPTADSKPVEPDTEDTFVEAAKQLVGPAPFESLLIPEALLRHIVVTIDNLPRERIALPQRPFKRTPGSFLVVAQGDHYLIDPRNELRYAALVKLFTGTETSLLVKLYLRYYPLFQQAYRELGYPDGYFNDRVIAVIDHLLATPEPTEPITLVQPKVYYEFADPQLESTSAGRKLLLRLSADDRATVKTKLAAIRAQLVSHAKPTTTPAP